MPTIKTFLGSSVCAPSPAIAQLTRAPKYAFGSNSFTLAARAYYKSDVQEMLVAWGMAADAARLTVGGMKLLKEEPESLTRMRSVGLLDDRVRGIWIWYQFVEGAPIVKLDASGTVEIVGHVQHWPMESRLIIEPVKVPGRRIVWRLDKGSWQSYRGFVNGVPLFSIDNAFGSSGIQLKSVLPGMEHEVWPVASRDDGELRAEGLLETFAQRLGAEFNN